MSSKQAILQMIDAQQVQFVDLWFTDITGIVKSVTVPSQQIERVLDHGIGFDGSSVEGFARVAESDMVLKPDVETFAILPWETARCTARLICNVTTLQGEPFIGDPRNVLIRALKQAEDMGYRYKTGMELEFFLFHRHTDQSLQPLLPLDKTSYFDLSTGLAKGVLAAMVEALTTMGIAVDSAHHENGAGQFEIDIEYDHSLAAADKVLSARVAMKAIAQAHNLHCTFMPRPDVNMAGSGMHTHQSLHFLQNDENALGDSGDHYGLSTIGRAFLAGQLAHARAMCAILAPLVNSYKRLRTSFEAPVYVTWAHINRSALIRVPYIGSGRDAHTRLELRCPDPAANPYLACAVMLMAGLDGVRQQLSLPDPVEEALVRQDRSRLRQLELLPASLGEALDVLEQSDTVLAALGPYISDRYLAAKRQEFEEYNRHVTRWEVDRYLIRY
jgi:glutamine synthetase